MFINPLEILDLQSAELSKIDNSVIKKAKRRLFAEIELSDHGNLIYKGIALSRSDCEGAVETLHAPGALSFFSCLLADASLNDFLVNGDERFLHDLEGGKQFEDQSFTRQISPHLAVSLNKVLLKFFKAKDAEMLQSALKTQALLEPSDLYKAHEGLNREIQERIHQVELLVENVRNEEVPPIPATALVTELFPPSLMDILAQHFQGNVNKVASAINLLAIALHETDPGNPGPQELYHWILRLNLDPGNRTLMQNNLEVVKEQEQLQRNSTCFFCKQPSEGLSIDVPMYLQTEMNGKQYTYNSTIVQIDQCSNCVSIHKRARRIFRNVFWSFTGSGSLLLSVLAFQQYNQPGGQYVSVFIFLTALLTAAYFTANSFKGKFLQKNEPRRRLSDIDLHWAVAAKLRGGWKLSKPDKHGKLPED